MSRWAARLKAKYGDVKAEAREVARIMAAAERAAPRPDLDPAEWQGEAER